MLPLGTGAPVYLDIQQWNAVLAALAEAPYRVSAPLIQAILGQLQHPLPPPPEPGMPAGPNGAVFDSGAGTKGGAAEVEAA
jgi:hypothetical protein